MATFSKQLWSIVKDSPQIKSATQLFTVDENFDLSSLVEYLAKFNPQMDPTLLFQNVELLDLSTAKDGIQFDDFDFEHFIEEYQVYEYQLQKKHIQFDESGTPLLSDKVIIKKDDFRTKASTVDALSLFLYVCVGFFKPVVPSYNFNLFRKNCEILGIDLPDSPKTSDYSQYLLYLFDVCECIQKFQDENNLSEAEMCACIYELAPTLYEESANEAELPLPTNIWLTGASKSDIKMIEEKGVGLESVWACNERTRRGDIVVLYALSPYSCIHSIWRAKSGGFFNPFDYYHNRTTVCDGVIIPPVTLQELHDDPIFGALKMMNNNLQGINGRELPASAYDSLLKIIERKGADIQNVPVLYRAKDWNPGDIKLEKDVEEKILIPVLKDLGYKENDWSRQLDLQAGRGLKAIPDFVFFASGDKHHEVAPFVIEAKKNMASNVQRRKDFNQGVSYAKMLSSTYLGMCDEERLVIYKRNKDEKFNYDSPVFEHHWAEISNGGDVMGQLKKMIGAEQIKALIKK